MMATLAFNELTKRIKIPQQLLLKVMSTKNQRVKRGQKLDQQFQNYYIEQIQVPEHATKMFVVYFNLVFANL